jgi:hypothetical protein
MTNKIDFEAAKIGEIVGCMLWDGKSKDKRQKLKFFGFDF